MNAIPNYELILSARKSFAIEVHPDLRIIVRAPKKMKLTEIDHKIKHRVDWIHKKLDYFRTHSTNTPSRKYMDGEIHLYLGKHYPLKITESNTHSIQLLHGHFEIMCIPPVKSEKVKILLDKWYLVHSKAIFETLLERCFPYFAQLGFAYPTLRIRHMKTRWGSLSSKGVVTLNSDLVRSPIECIEYVVFHELCHLKHKRHGKRFYNLLEKVLPDWKQRRQQLRLLIT